MADKILVVDDESVILALMADILGEEGYEVATASNGRQALDMLAKSDEFILLFTDIMMPEMDGIALIREARKICPALIPIVMTGFATLETARAAVKEGAYDYVLKPFSLSEVKLAVMNAIERHHLQQENTRLREVTELFRISEALASIQDEHQLLDFVLRAALRRVGAERGSVMVASSDGQRLEVAVSVGIPERDAKITADVGASISGWVAQNVKPLLVSDIDKTPDVAAKSRNLEDRSFISVPLERKNLPAADRQEDARSEPEVLAVLNVNKKTDGGLFSEADLKILSIVANHAAAALQNVRLIKHIEDAHLATLRSMALMLEAKDAYTHGHSQRVCSYALLTARQLRMSEKDIEVIRAGAALHDVGKIGVKDSILNKNGKPTSEEWETIKRHPVIGYEVLQPVRSLTKEHLHLVRSHHEQVDGGGYPDGLKGDQLSAATRILVVADAYDAMASSRAYRSALSPERIVKELTKNSGTQFDPRIARLFVELIKRGALPLKE